MHKTTAALAVSMLTLTMALPAAAKPVYDDTLVLSWDGNSITYANGEVTFDVSLTMDVVCGWATLVATEAWSGTVPAVLEMKNSLRTASLSFETDRLDIVMEGGCDIGAAAMPGSITVDVAVDGSTDRQRDAAGRTILRSGSAVLAIFGDVAVSAELKRVVSR
jgi:hypothetical protein